MRSIHWLFSLRMTGLPQRSHALDDLLVGEDALAAGAPVHGHGRLVGQAVLVHLQEYPLGPLVIFRVGGVDHAVPVKAVAEHLQLLGKALDIALCDVVGLHVVLDAQFSVGRPKASEPIGKRTFSPSMRRLRATMSIAVYGLGWPTWSPSPEGYGNSMRG